VAFTLACGVGGLANVGIASYLFTAEVSWLLSALAGIVVGAVWNYAVTSVCIWRRPSSLRRGDRREKTAAPAGLL
jgi:dolichol-phosphate mannosyltransferase